MLKTFPGVFCNISNTRMCVSSDIQTPRSRLKNEAQPSFFLNDFEVYIQTYPNYDHSSDFLVFS